MGFAGIFRSDHLTQMGPPPMDALEALISLAYLASNSYAVHFGTLVAPLSFRDLPVLCWRNEDELERLAQGVRKAFSVVAHLSTAELLPLLHEQFAAITGSPEQVTTQILAYARAGAEERMCQWILLDDLLGLEILGKGVLPAVIHG